MSEQAPNNPEYLQHHPDAIQDVNTAHEVAEKSKKQHDQAAVHREAERFLTDAYNKDYATLEVGAHDKKTPFKEAISDYKQEKASPDSYEGRLAIKAVKVATKARRNVGLGYQLGMNKYSRAHEQSKGAKLVLQEVARKRANAENEAERKVLMAEMDQKAEVRTLEDNNA